MDFGFQCRATKEGIVVLRVLGDEKPLLEVNCDPLMVSELVANLLLSSFDARQLSGKAEEPSTPKHDLPLVLASRMSTLTTRPSPDREVIAFEFGDAELGVAVSNDDLQQIGALLMLASAAREKKQ